MNHTFFGTIKKPIICFTNKTIYYELFIVSDPLECSLVMADFGRYQPSSDEWLTNVVSNCYSE